MDGFLSWFFAFMTTMLGGVWQIISNLVMGIVTIFNLPAYFTQMGIYTPTFGIIDWIFMVLAFILVYSIWFVILLMIVLLIRKYIRFRRTIVGNEDLLEELANLHRDVIRLTQEKEKIMALKVGQSNVTLDQINELLGNRSESISIEDTNGKETGVGDDEHAAVPATTGKTCTVGTNRFFRLTAVDEKYKYYVPLDYNKSMSLETLCDDFRNFCCSRMHLYYDIRTIRLMFAGLAATKMILLQGISGTGKTSLPYAMGKYFLNDATIASVQPSWRDRTELFGYFNEFTKKFNETETLRRIYEASYNDDINIIVLDEMNIARVEYYFAEMLSVLEMPDPNEWKLELVASSWPDDPHHLQGGKLTIPQNVWYVGTANNDDSTFAVSDKVYDRAFTINLDSKGQEFPAPDTLPKQVSYSYISGLYDKAIGEHPVNRDFLTAISKLDLYVIQKFRVAFGNRIMKQLHIFLPVFVACGGSELEGLDYLLATKVFRKFEGLNLSLIREEIKGLIAFLDSLFGKGEMKECIAYLLRLEKTY